jgi:O-acetyl-ADP-ribose deacetylase (regulator of RNase III)
MPIEFVTGDLFTNRFGAQALAHGCNCQGSMGAGIATGFRDRYPAMFAEYRRRCKAKPREFNLGDVFLWKADCQPWVFNLATQEGTFRARASYQAIETALRVVRKQADREGVASIAVPRIGAGTAGSRGGRCGPSSRRPSRTGRGRCMSTRSSCRRAPRGSEWVRS